MNADYIGVWLYSILLTELCEPNEIIEYYFSLGAKLIVLKKGAHGVLVSNGKKEKDIPGYDVKVTDSTGAGDVFNGAFLAELLRGNDPFTSAAYANAAAAVSTTNYGAVNSIPNRVEVKKFLRKFA